MRPDIGYTIWNIVNGKCFGSITRHVGKIIHNDIAEESLLQVRRETTNKMPRVNWRRANAQNYSHIKPQPD